MVNGKAVSAAAWSARAAAPPATGRLIPQPRKGRAMTHGRPAETKAGIAVQRGPERFQTQTAWLDSRHSFSFGPHHDPLSCSPPHTMYGVCISSPIS